MSPVWVRPLNSLMSSNKKPITGLQSEATIANTFRVLFLTLRIVLCAILFTVSPVAAIEKPQNIDWDNLIPRMPKLENPFAMLTNEQAMDFEFLISTQNMRQRSLISNVDEVFSEGVEIRSKLERQGLGVDKLIADFKNLEKEVERRNNIMNTQLDNKFVRIPGYALPLEHQDTAVRELLLVPYVGACIHVPPPPANQTVYVRLNKAHTFNDLYEPVWITGQISIKAASQKLFLVDGSADIDTGYALEGVRIEPYEEE